MRARAICARCSDAELDALGRAMSYREAAPGETLAEAGRPSPFLGSVVEGVAAMSRLMPDGRRQVVGLLFPGDFVGRPLQAAAAFDVVAATPMRLCAFPRATFESLFRRSADLERRLLEMTQAELDAARDWMVLLGRKTARERLASFLVMVATRASRRGADPDPTFPSADRPGSAAPDPAPTPPDGVVVDAPLTREAMGEHLGLTVETVSRQIGALRRDGVIQLLDARRIRIPSWAALERAAGGDPDRP